MPVRRIGSTEIAAASALAGTSSATPAKGRIVGSARSPIVELRQYTLHEGQRGKLIDLFEREFIESQEVLGMKVLGTFRDLDRPNRFVWLRGFADMNSRLSGLTEFYGGPVWKAHRDAANATMVDSDNVLLLHAPGAIAEFDLPRSQTRAGEQRPLGFIVATIYHLSSSSTAALAVFETQVKPQLAAAGVKPIAWFLPETAPNNFPRLPVREGERVLVWFARFKSDADLAHHLPALEEAATILAPSLEGQPEVLRLCPTKRSQLR